jgi:acetyl esterase/lipase
MRTILAVLLLALPQQGRPPAVPDDVEVVRDVEFGTGGGRPLKMHLVRPKSPPKEPMAAVVYVHGGAWRAGNRDAGLRPLSRLAQRGYFGASIEYRLSQEARFPAQIEDCKAAVRFLRSKAKAYGIDPDRIGAWGPSAGGHLVALLGTSGDVKELEGKGGHAEFSSRVQAVVDWFGPTDFLKMGKNRIDHDAAGSPESLLVGGPIRENPEKVAAANPVTYVSKDDPPFLIMHGDRDDLVPIGQSELLHAALGRSGVASTLHVVKGAGHGFGGPELDSKVDEFLDRHLRGARRSP